MALARETLELSSQLDKAGDAERQLDVLRSLDGLAMTYEILIGTKAGHSLKPLKKSRSPEVSRAATALTRKWRALRDHRTLGEEAADKYSSRRELFKDQPSASIDIDNGSSYKRSVSPAVLAEPLRVAPRNEDQQNGGPAARKKSKSFHMECYPARYCSECSAMLDYGPREDWKDKCTLCFLAAKEKEYAELEAARLEKERRWRDSERKAFAARFSASSSSVPLNSPDQKLQKPLVKSPEDASPSNVLKLPQSPSWGRRCTTCRAPLPLTHAKWKTKCSKPDCWMK
jgi:hypothetical protein